MNFNKPPQNNNEESKYNNFTKKIKNTLLGVAALTTVGMSASAQKTEGKQTNPIKPTTEAVTKAFANAEKVFQDPTTIDKSYTKAEVKDGKTFYIKTIGGTEGSIATAIPGGPKDNKANEEFLIAQLKKGISPEELVKGGHASAVGIHKLAHFYVPPAIKVVYTETAPTPKIESDPFAAFSKDGMRIFGPNRHGVLDFFVPIRSTHKITDPGHVTGQDVLVRILDQRNGGDHEGKYTGDYIVISGDEMFKLDNGRDAIDSQTDLDNLIQRAKEYTASQKNKTTNHLNKDLADNK